MNNTLELINGHYEVNFEEIRLDSGGKVVAVKPRPELEPFFRLSYECHSKDIASDPGGI